VTTVRRADLASSVDCAAIDAFLESRADATPFHRRAWVEAVTRGCGHRAHYLVAGQSDLTGILPLHEVHSMLFGRALVSSGFGVGGGILAKDPASIEALGTAAWQLATETSCPTLELRGGMVPQDWAQDTTTYLNFARNLAADDETELLAIPRKQRADVRKALGNDLTVDIGDCAAHYAVYAESVRNLGTPVFPRSLFSEVLDAFGDDADVLTVRKDGVPLASVLSLYHRGVVMPYWGGGTAIARSARANDMMYFALMRHARERGCTRFDFGRSKTGTGAAAFKHNWGFEGVPLAYAKRSVGKAREINPLDPQYSRKVQLWQKLPLAIANRLGPMIARGLG
jgi:FemAB-related protein (PEP-CTERM system-associated)